MVSPNPWMIVPFGALLALLAVVPACAPEWWHKHYTKVAGAFIAGVSAYYLGALNSPGRLGASLRDYIEFISLVGSLFVVSGGIRISVRGEATPLANILFLLAGALCANILGTTGTSILLIRPWISMNRYRVTGYHIVFFIFIVSNVGGCLTPIGVPPLYLGYLRGVPFWWVAQNCWAAWVVGVGVLLAMFYWLDRKNFLRAPQAVRSEKSAHEEFRFEGLRNLILLVVILAATFLRNPPFLREIIMLAAATASYYATPAQVHTANEFNFAPLREVAILFAAIFATMMPALDWLEANAARYDSLTPSLFYAGSGTLSSVLDNAPTYLVFLSALLGNSIDAATVGQIQAMIASHNLAAPPTGPHAIEIADTIRSIRHFFAGPLATGTLTPNQIRMAFLLGHPALTRLLAAISVGSAFFGANTYIGNAPNFMVKAIAEHAKVRTPGFLGYVLRFTLPFMIPMLAIVWFLFFRG